MNNLINFLSQNAVIKVFGISLLHSLWQGAGIAFLLWLLISLGKGLSSKIRYLLAFISLIILTGTFVWTFYQCYSALPPSSQAVMTVQEITPDELFRSGTPRPEGENLLYIAEAVLNHILFWLNLHVHYVFLAWCFGFIFLSGRFFTGLSYLEKIKKNSEPLPESWLKRMNALQSEIGLKKKVLLLSSLKVTAPLTFGWIKPAIVFPLSLLAQLPADQVESILLHELAHIRRKDYLLNIFISVTEMFFFFNPAFWYISAILDRERENACDDLVLSTTGNSISYARALVQLAEICSLGNNSPAMSIAKEKNGLFLRIKRIIENSKTDNQMNSSFKNRAYHLLPLTIFCVLLAAFSLEATEEKQSGLLLSNNQMSEQDSVKNLPKNSLSGRPFLIKGGYFQSVEIRSNEKPQLFTMEADSIIFDLENRSVCGYGNSEGDCFSPPEETESSNSYNPDLLKKQTGLILKKRSGEANHNSGIRFLLVNASEFCHSAETEQERLEATIASAISSGKFIKNLNEVNPASVGSVTLVKQGVDIMYILNLK